MRRVAALGLAAGLASCGAAAAPPGDADSASTPHASEPVPGADAFASASEMVAGAEALAWGGRLFEAERAYRRTIDATRGALAPEVAARAWMGLGNVYLWSGRRAEALACFDSSLALRPESAEARRVRSELRSQSGARWSLDGALVTDSADFAGQRTRLRLEPGAASRRGPRALLFADRVARGAQDGSNLGLAAGAAAELGAGWSGSVLLGASRADGAPATPHVEVALGRRALRRPRFDIVWEHGDRAFDLRSRAARDARLRGHEVRLSTYEYLGNDRGIWLGGRAGSLSDGNRYAAFTAGFEARPLARFRSIVDLYAIDYARRSALYWAPNREWSAGLRFEASAWRTRASQADVAVSWGRAGNSWTDGSALGLQMRLQQALFRRTNLCARLEYAESFQSTRYIARTFWLELQHEGGR